MTTHANLSTLTLQFVLHFDLAGQLRLVMLNAKVIANYICFSNSVMYIRTVVTLVFTSTFQAVRCLASLLNYHSLVALRRANPIYGLSRNLTLVSVYRMKRPSRTALHLEKFYPASKKKLCNYYQQKLVRWLNKCM